MSDYLHNLVSRRLSTDEVLKPRLISLFEPQTERLGLEKSPDRHREGIIQASNEIENENTGHRLSSSEREIRPQNSILRSDYEELNQSPSSKKEAFASDSIPEREPYEELARPILDANSNRHVPHELRHAWNAPTDDEEMASDADSRESDAKRSAALFQNQSPMMPPSPKMEANVSDFSARTVSIDEQKLPESASKVEDLNVGKRNVSSEAIESETWLRDKDESITSRSKIAHESAANERMENSIVKKSNSFGNASLEPEESVRFSQIPAASNGEMKGSSFVEMIDSIVRVKPQLESPPLGRHIKPKIAATNIHSQPFSKDDAIIGASQFMAIPAPNAGSPLTGEVSMKTHRLRSNPLPEGRKASAPDDSPNIKVTIGRIDVRAVMPPTPSRPEKEPAGRESILSLDEYLKRQGGEKR
jgi:hypothetical protein